MNIRENTHINKMFKSLGLLVPEEMICSDSWYTSIRTRFKRKRKIPDSVLWQKPLRPQKNPKSNVTSQTRNQNLDYTTITDRLRTLVIYYDYSIIQLLQSESGQPFASLNYVHLIVQ